MAAQYEFHGTLRATCRVWDVDIGGIPSNWEQPSFDDSAWPLSATPAQGNSSYSNEYIQEGIQAVSPWVSPPTTTSAFLFRFHFNAPANPPWNHWQWDFKHPGGGIASSNQIAFYINGSPFATQQVPASSAVLHNYSADNVIAGLLNPAGSPGGGSWGTDAWCAFRDIFFIPVVGSQAYAWGTITPGVNDKGVFGVGDTATHLTPTPCVGLPGDVAKVVSNGKTTLFLTSDGNLYGCGDNSTGLFGLGSTDTSAHPTPVPIYTGGAASPIADVSIGNDCAIYMLSDGQARGWGPNASGSLGLGDTSPRLTAVNLGIAQGTALYPGRVSCGKNFSIIVSALAGSSSPLAAGDNTYGQLGLGTSGAAVTTRTAMINTNFPTDATGGKLPPVQASCGDDQTFLLFNDGIIFGGNFLLSGGVLGCGRAEYGSLGGTAYSVGTGVNKIVSTPRSIYTGTDQVQQTGPLSFFKGLVGLLTVAQTTVMGDGTPYGGAGDGGFNPLPPVADPRIYGSSPTFLPYDKTGGGGDGALAIPIDSFSASLLWPLDGLAESGAGSQNPYGTGPLLGTTNASGSVAYVAAPAHINLITLTNLDANAKYLAITFNNPGSGTVGYWLDWFDSGGSPLAGNPVALTAEGAGQTDGLVFIAVPSTAAKYDLYGVLLAPGSGNTNVSVLQVTNATESKAAFAAFGYWSLYTSSGNVDRTSDGKLYTWGWGGAGQMGSGTDATTNITPIAVNGLSNVIGATVVAAGIFAISAIGVTTTTTRGRSFGMVVG